MHKSFAATALLLMLLLKIPWQCVRCGFMQYKDLQERLHKSDTVCSFLDPNPSPHHPLSLFYESLVLVCLPSTVIPITGFLFLHSCFNSFSGLNNFFSASKRLAPFESGRLSNRFLQCLVFFLSFFSSVVKYLLFLVSFLSLSPLQDSDPSLCLISLCSHSFPPQVRN